MHSIPKITEAEWTVMKVIWAHGRATTNEVVDALTPVTPWKPKTIMTLLKRLTDKGALEFELKGRVYEYIPRVAETECLRAESQSFLQRFFGGALSPMLSQFLDDRRLTPEEIEELRHLLDAKEKEQ